MKWRAKAVALIALAMGPLVASESPEQNPPSLSPRSMTGGNQLLLFSHGEPQNNAPHAYLRVRAPKLFAEKVLDFAHWAYPSASTKILPMMFLGFWGYPDFPGISEKDLITLFIFPWKSVASRKHWVAFARIEPTSPLWSTIALQGFCTKRIGNWTLITRHQKFLDRVLQSDELEMLHAIARERDDNDVEFHCTAPFLSQLMNPKQPGKSPLWKQFHQLRCLYPFLNQVDELAFYGNFDGPVLRGKILLKIRSGTSLDEILKGDFTTIPTEHVARVTPGNSLQRFLFRYDPKDLKEVMRNCLQRVLTSQPTDAEIHVTPDELDHFLHTLFRNDRGVYSFCSKDLGGKEERRIWNCFLRARDLERCLQFGYERLFPILFAKAADVLDFCDWELHTAVDPKAFNYRGVTVFKTNVAVDGRWKKMSSEFSPMKDTFHSQWDHFYATLKDYVISSSTEEGMRRMIDDLKRGYLVYTQPCSKPLAEREIFRFVVHPPELERNEDEGGGETNDRDLHLSLSTQDGVLAVDFTIFGDVFGRLMNFLDSGSF